MHEDRVLGGRVHEFVVDAVRHQHRGVALRETFLAHRGPDVGVHDVGFANRTIRARERARRRIIRFAEFVQFRKERFARPMRRRRTEAHVRAHHHGRFRERPRDVVARVADVGDSDVFQRAEAVFDGEEIRERLARVRGLGEPVDDGHGRGGR